jgi:hypothetical protein
MTGTRAVLVTIDSLLEIMRGYLGEDQLPADAKAVRLRLNPQHANKLALEVESPEIRGDPVIEVKFDLRRYV